MAVSIIPNKNNNERVYATRLTNGKWTAGTISLWKCNGIVFVKVEGIDLSSVSSRETIGTIPEGYRPLTESYIFPTDKKGMILMEATGEIKADPRDAARIWGTECYIAG